MNYYHIRIDYKDKPQDQSLKDLEDLEYIKNKFILPYMRKKDFLFNGKRIVFSEIDKIRIYESNYDIVEIKRVFLASHPNIYGFSGYYYENKDMIPEITYKVFSECQNVIEKEEQKEKNKKIIMWIFASLASLYSFLCLFQFMDCYNLFNAMNLEGATSKVISLFLSLFLPWLKEKFTLKDKK